MKSNDRLNVTLICTAAFIGIGSLFLHTNQQSAFAQPQGKPGVVWEYKVVSHFTREENAAKEMNTKFDELGAEGWEVVGAAFAYRGGVSSCLTILKRAKH